MLNRIVNIEIGITKFIFDYLVPTKTCKCIAKKYKLYSLLLISKTIKNTIDNIYKNFIIDCPTIEGYVKKTLKKNMIII